MKTKRKNTVIAISPDIHNEFKKYCAEHGMKLGAAAEKAIANYLVLHRPVQA